MENNGIRHQSGTRTISVELWHELTRDGADVPVRIQLQGYSMCPLIRCRRDYVTIRPVFRPLIRGDIVLFRRPDGVYAAHRVWKLSENTIQTLGDNCYDPDAPVAAGDVLGLVTHVTRGERTFCVDTPIWRFLGRCWSSLLPLHRIRMIASDVLRSRFRR